MLLRRTFGPYPHTGRNPCNNTVRNNRRSGQGSSSCGFYGEAQRNVKLARLHTNSGKSEIGKLLEVHQPESFSAPLLMAVGDGKR